VVANVPRTQAKLCAQHIFVGLGLRLVAGVCSRAAGCYAWRKGEIVQSKVVSMGQFVIEKHAIRHRDRIPARVEHVDACAFGLTDVVGDGYDIGRHARVERSLPVSGYVMSRERIRTIDVAVDGNDYDRKVPVQAGTRVYEFVEALCRRHVG
jgi:hypothetical protein